MERTMQYRFAYTLCATAIVFCVLLSWLVVTASAYATDLVCEGVSYAYDDDGVKCEPSNAWNIVLGFSGNVAVALEGEDDSFIQRNLSRVHLLKADGSEVGNWHASVQGGGKRVIYIELEDWLEPLTEYQVVVNAGLEAASGVNTMPAQYQETFKTGSMTKNGFTVYQNICFVVIPLLLTVGIGVQIARVRRQGR